MTGTLSIGQIDAEYLTDRAALNPSAIHDRCDEALRSKLKDALSATLSRWCNREDSSIWLVRRVDIDVATTTGFPSDELSHSIAYVLATTLRDVLVGEGDGVEVNPFRRCHCAVGEIPHRCRQRRRMESLVLPPLSRFADVVDYRCIAHCYWRRSEAGLEGVTKSARVGAGTRFRRLVCVGLRVGPNAP